MALRETKERINSVKGTLKITTAMKFVASSKLHKAQNAIEAMIPYQQALSQVFQALGNGRYGLEGKQGGKVAIVAMASNTSLCGTFNATILKAALEQVEKYPEADIYAIGRRMAEPLAKAGHPSVGDFTALMAKPDYVQASALADRLRSAFQDGAYSKVILVYNHFASFVSQQVKVESLLPFEVPVKEKDHLEDEFIVEPGAEEIAARLLPEVLRLKIYTTLLDSSAAENAARTIAMQTASDNAQDLLNELTLEYNKARQQKITNEILDLIGGSQQ